MCWLVILGPSVQISFVFYVCLVVLFVFYTMVVRTLMSVVTFHAAAAIHLIKEMKNRFPLHIVLNAMRIVYPEYWSKDNGKKAMDSFPAHLEVIKKHF